MFPGKDRTRFVSRVTAVGDGWVEFERPLTTDVRLKWGPVLHRFAPSLVESGFENFQMVFRWSALPAGPACPCPPRLPLPASASRWLPAATSAH